MGTYDKYRTDRDREETGVWVTMLDGSRWRLRRANSMAARKALRDAQRPYELLIRQAEARGEDMPEEILDRINLDYSVYGIVTGWEGVTGPDGQPLTFTPDAVRQILQDLPDLHLAVIRESGRTGNFASALEEAAEKNSERPVAGS